jgi:DNA polymerase-3 subunit epsilon/ATP-dependent DNA helicase DinG
MPRTYVALDIETTGLEPERDAIIEIGAVKFRGDEVLDTWSFLVNPGRPLPYKIERLTGITPADLEHAPALSVVLDPLSNFVKDYPIIGHSIAFDIGFCKRFGLFAANPTIDTLELAGILMPYASRYGLGHLAQTLGIRFAEQHRALADALMAKELFIVLLRRAAQLEFDVIQQINRLAAGSDWPLRHVFQDIEKESARTAFSGTIRQQLRAKGGIDAQALGLFLAPERERALRPAAHETSLDTESLAAMLERDGVFAQRFPGYEHRPQQIKMLRAVADTFNAHEHLLVEGGTGVGKSVAYLLPAIYFAGQNNEHVVISTNTINLQDQLFNKDIPDIQKLVPLQFKSVLLKGRSNYLCPRRWSAFLRGRGLTNDEIRVAAKILVWLPTSATGDSAELVLPDRETEVWSKVCASEEYCRPETCQYQSEGRCFFYHARHRAEGAHLIIVNHALLISDIAVENRVLPEHRYLIVDEAHHLEARATEQLGFDVERGRAAALLASIGGRRRSGFISELWRLLGDKRVPPNARGPMEDILDEVSRQAEEATERLDTFFATLARFVEEHSEESGEYDRRLRFTTAMRVQPAWGSVEMAWEDLSLPLFRVAEGLGRLQSGFAELAEQGLFEEEDAVQELAARAYQVRLLREQMKEIIAEPSNNGIYWATTGAENNELALHAAPLHVGPILAEKLFSQKECVILTSATLSTNGDFGFLCDRLGLEDARQLVVGSPFDYASTTLLYLPTDVPEPGQPGYQRTVEEILIELCQVMHGRTMVLFTSHSQLKSTYRAISKPLGDQGIVVLGQGIDGSARRLLEQFKTGEPMVLLGTRSFWEGIDVVGEALSCLVITRLPFSVPTDPIFAARSEAFEDHFGQYAVPEAVLRLRQGFGRLIRSTTDRGVVVILDKRVQSKSYGQAFLNSLPPCTVRHGPLSDLAAQAARWLRGETSFQRPLLI